MEDRDGVRERNESQRERVPEGERLRERKERGETERERRAGDWSHVGGPRNRP